MTTHRIAASLAFSAGVALVVSALVGAGALAEPNLVVRIAGSDPPHTLDDLYDTADAIAIIVPTGDVTLRWNTREDRPWALEELGRRSHLFRDEAVRVTEHLFGTLADTFVLRGVGGTRDGIRLDYVDEPPMSAGTSYLTFLRYVETPTKEGVEPRWTLLWQSYGLFEQTATGWENHVGMQLTIDEVRSREVR